METTTELIKPILPAPGEEEIWKTCVGYEEYEVSSFGNVRRKSTQHMMKPGGTNTSGYLVVHLRAGVSNPKGKHVRVHRLVLEAFCEKEHPEQEFADHIDRNRHNNYYKNLRWTTQQENNNNRKDHKDYHSMIWKNRTPIVLLDKETHEVIKYYSCINQASEELGLSGASIASNVRGCRRDFRIGCFKTVEDFNLEKEQKKLD